MATKISSNFDWQGHRGTRGLLPENTIPAFLKALEYPKIKTLELDLAVSKDGKLVVSHDPFMVEDICSLPNGEPIPKGEAMKYNIYQMYYDEIVKFDCGKRGNPRFPQQKAQPAIKPLFEDMILAADKYAEQLGRPLPFYNIEIKSDPRGDDLFHPKPFDFALMVWDLVTKMGIQNRMDIQSFDIRPLQELHKWDKNITLALLVENKEGVEANLQKLGFMPQTYSCYHELLTKADVDLCHKKGIKVIPWTVNDQKIMKTMIAMGVDGIITDYPNLITADIF